MKRRDPLLQALITCAILVAVGLLAIGLGKRVVARTEDVYDQLPALVSGGLGGIALVIIGCVFALVQVSRVCAEQERLQQAAILDEVSALTEVRRRLAVKRAATVEGSPEGPDVAIADVSRRTEDDTVAIPVIRPVRVRRPRPSRPVDTTSAEARPVRRPRRARVDA